MELDFEEVQAVASKRRWYGSSRQKDGIGIYQYNFRMDLGGNVMLGLSRAKSRNSSTPLYLLRVFVDTQHVQTFSGQEVKEFYDAAVRMEHGDSAHLNAGKKNSLIRKVRSEIRNVGVSAGKD
jgi:hypothetical protein